MKLLIVLFLFCICFSQAKIEGQVLSDLLKWHHLQVASIFHCPNEEEGSISLVRYIQREHHGVVSFVEPSAFSERKFVASIHSVHVPVGLVVDMRCHGLDSVLDALSRRGYFNGGRYSWLLFGSDTLDTNRLLLQNLNVTVSSNMVLVQPMGSAGEDIAANMAVLDVSGRWAVNRWQLSMVQIGSWNMLTGLEIWDKRGVYQRRLNLDGIHLNCINTKDPDSRTNSGIHQNERHRDNLAYGGLLWNIFSLIHNFSSSDSTVESFGSVTPQFNVVKNVVEIKQDNVRALHYTVAVGEAETGILFVHPDTYRTKNICLRPFSVHLWLAIGSFLILFGLMLYKIFVREGSLGYERNRMYQLSGNGIVVLVLGIFCQQGFVNRANSHATRITLFSMLMFTALMYQVYISSIVSFLLVVQPKDIKSLEQLKRNEFSIAIEQENVELFNVTEGKDLFKLYQHQLSLNGPIYYSMTEGMSLVARGRHAFICDVQQGYNIIQRHFTDGERCAVQKIRLLPKKPLHMALAKDSPFTELFRVTAQKMNGHGLTQYQRKLLFADEPKCVENEVKMPEVNLDQVSSLFLLLLCGVTGRVGLLLVEILASKVSKRR